MTTLQPFTPGQPYLFNGLDIPSQQTLPPAGQSSFAFRPACGQLTEATIPGSSSEVYWGMSYNNDFYAFSVKPAGMGIQQAYLHLDAEGNCKVNGVEVPLVPASSLPKPLLPEVITEVAAGQLTEAMPDEVPLPTTSLVGAFILMCGLALIGFGLTKKSAKSNGTSMPATGEKSALSTLLELANND